MVAGELVDLVLSVCKPPVLVKTDDLQILPPLEVDQQTLNSSTLPASACSRSQPPVEVGRSLINNIKTQQCSQFQPPVEVVARAVSTILPTPVQVIRSSAVGAETTLVSSQSKLSITAPVFKPIQQLFPPGMDRYGRQLLTVEAAMMQLEYFELSEDPIAQIDAAEKDIEDTKKLGDWPVQLPDGKVFIDKILPPLPVTFDVCEEFPPAYFIDLHNKVIQRGTYNFAGARVELKHCKIDVTKFRDKLCGYDDIGVLQFVQFGFPIGLAQEFELESCAKNHSSALEYFTCLLKFQRVESLGH